MPDIIKEAEYIRNMVNNEMYDISPHANQRMNERNMSFEELEDIILMSFDKDLAKSVNKIKSPI